MATNLDRLRSIQVSALSKEAAFGTAEAVDSLLRLNLGVIPSAEVQTINDNDHIGGTEEPTEAEVYARSLAFPWNQTRAKPHTVAHFAGYAMGAISSTLVGTTVMRHVITPTTELTQPSFSMEAKKKAGVQRLYTGCFVDAFTLAVQRGANRFVNLSGQAYGSGVETAGTANVSEKLEGGLNAADAAVWLDDTTYDGATDNSLGLTTSDLVSNPAPEGDKAIGLEWTFQNNIDLDFAYLIGSGLFIGNNDRTARSQMLSYTRLYQDDTFADGLLAQTEYCLQFRVRNALVEAGYYYGIDLVFPLLQIATRKEQEQGGRLTETLTFHVLQHATQGSVKLSVFNLQAGYAA